MKNSFVSKIKIYLFSLIVIIVGILCIFLYSSYKILSEEIQKNSSDFLAIYTRDIKNDLSSIDKNLVKVTSDYGNLQMLKSKDSNRRVLASINLQNNMHTEALDSDFNDITAVLEVQNGTFLVGSKKVISTDYNDFLKTTLISVLEEKDTKNFEWVFIDYNGETILYKYYVKNDIIVAVFVKTKDLLRQFNNENIENRSIYLVDNQGNIGEVWGNKLGSENELININELSKNKYYIQTSSLLGGQLNLVCVTDKSLTLNQIYLSMIVLVVSVVLAILFLLYIFYFVRRQIITPMECIIEDLDIIKEGDYENRITAEFDSQEFQVLKDTSNEMLDRIVGLKMQSYIRKIEMQDMELKSIQLKLKPHFFLNALTTISSLSKLGENEMIEKYIDILSKNIRYMFKSGISLVPVKEELEQVENYFYMQECKYPNSVFTFIELPEELGDWKIPHMLIHTFVENIYKHTISVDTVTTVFIKVSMCNINEKEYLYIEIEDDGIGYSQNVIDSMNCDDFEQYKQGNHIGLMSLKTLLYLLYQEDGLMEIGNGTKGGCANKIYIPKNTKI